MPCLVWLPGSGTCGEAQAGRAGPAAGAWRAGRRGADTMGPLDPHPGVCRHPSSLYLSLPRTLPRWGTFQTIYRAHPELNIAALLCNVVTAYPKTPLGAVAGMAEAAIAVWYPVSAGWGLVPPAAAQSRCGRSQHACQQPVLILPACRRRAGACPLEPPSCRFQTWTCGPTMMPWWRGSTRRTLGLQPYRLDMPEHCPHACASAPPPPPPPRPRRLSARPPPAELPPGLPRIHPHVLCAAVYLGCLDNAVGYLHPLLLPRVRSAPAANAAATLHLHAPPLCPHLQADCEGQGARRIVCGPAGGRGGGAGSLPLHASPPPPLPASG